MNRISLFMFFLVFAFSFLLPNIEAKSQENDFVATAVSALQTSNVYVHTNAVGVNSDTVDVLSTYLTNDSQIVLVMLPFDALREADINTLAQQISMGLNNQKTVGLAIGSNLVGYSMVVPEAASMMERAKSVSNNPVTALVAFSQSVQVWYDNRPAPTPTAAPTRTPKPTPTPIELPKAEDMSLTVWVFLSLVVLVVLFVVAKNAKLLIRRMSLEQKRSQISNIENKVAKIQDYRLRSDLQDACLAANGLLDIFLQSKSFVGKAEAEFPYLLTYVNRQVAAYLNHESGKRPLGKAYLSELTSILLSYDSLFVKLQENDPETVELLTSMIHSKNSMISSMGYLPDDE